jgi:K+-transporting ATPase A subunit
MIKSLFYDRKPHNLGAFISRITTIMNQDESNLLTIHENVARVYYKTFWSYFMHGVSYSNYILQDQVLMALYDYHILLFQKEIP